MSREPTIIHCEEIAVDPILITLGSVTVDVAKISAYNSIRMLQLIKEVEAKEAKPAEAAELVLDIIREQGQDITQDELLQAGNQMQLNKFVQTVVKYTLKTYAPLQRAYGPFPVPAKTPERKHTNK